MSVYTDIKKLIEKTNNDYLQSFMDYIQKESKPEFSTQLRTYISKFQLKNKKPIVSRKCQYIIKRGLNSGKPCLNTIKEVDDIMLCTKHRKRAVEVQQIQSISDEDECVIEDEVVSEEGDEEEWFAEEHFEDIE